MDVGFTSSPSEISPICPCEPLAEYFLAPGFVQLAFLMSLSLQAPQVQSPFYGPTSALARCNNDLQLCPLPLLSSRVGQGRDCSL